MKRKSTSQLNKRSTKAIIWCLVALLLPKGISPTHTFPSNTQVSSFTQTPGVDTNRVNISPDKQSYTCRYNYDVILVLKKSVPQPIQVRMSEGGLGYQIAINNKNIAIGYLTSKKLEKHLYSVTSTSLVRQHTLNAATESIAIMIEFKPDLPFIFGAGSAKFYSLIDYTKDTGEMMPYYHKSTNSALGTFNPYATAFWNQNTPKIITANNNNVLVRFGYLSGGVNPLLIEDTHTMSFSIKKLQKVKNTDFVFTYDVGTSDAYLMNPLGPLDGSHVLKKVALPADINKNAYDLLQVNLVYGKDDEHFLQVWAFNGRAIWFTFPKTGQTPQYHGEMWHKWWRQRYDVKYFKGVFNSYYLPETGDFFSCRGCGSDNGGPCMYSWQCSPSCSTCTGPGQTECTSCPTGSDLQNGACIKECADKQYRKSKTECVDCPADHLYIKSNLTCVNCWEHNDYAECAYTRLAYRISLVHDSFLNISFTYKVSFYGEQRSLQKLSNKSINWPGIFEVDILKEGLEEAPDCQKPVYEFREDDTELRIELKQCQREAKFYLRTLRRNILQGRFRVFSMLNISSENILNHKILTSSDDLPWYARILKPIVWILALAFLIYLLVSDLEFVKIYPLKLIGNFLQMVDFIQCLSLLEVKYRVLTTKFFWLIGVVFNSPQFEVYRAYLNDEQDLKREAGFGKVYGEYGDRLAFNNYDLVMTAYLVSVVLDTLIGVFPWKIFRVRTVVEGFREFMFSYAFFEFLMNIVMDLANIKRILRHGNRLSVLLFFFEMVILFGEVYVIVIKLIKSGDDEDTKKKIDENLGKKGKGSGDQRKNEKDLNKKLRLDTERQGLIDGTTGRGEGTFRQSSLRVHLGVNQRGRKRRPRTNLLGGRGNQGNTEGSGFEAKESIKSARDDSKNKNRPNQRSMSLAPPSLKQNHLNSSKRVQIQIGEKSTKDKLGRKKSGCWRSLAKRVDILREIRFFLIQVLITTLREPTNLQVITIFVIQVFMTIIVAANLILIKNQQSSLSNSCYLLQELAICSFILLIPILGSENSLIEYALIVTLSASIVMELIMIAYQLLIHFLLGLVNLFKRIKNRSKKGSKNDENETEKKQNGDEEQKDGNGDEKGGDNDEEEGDLLGDAHDQGSKKVAENELNGRPPRNEKKQKLRVKKNGKKRNLKTKNLMKDQKNEQGDNIQNRVKSTKIPEVSKGRRPRNEQKSAEQGGRVITISRSPRKAPEKKSEKQLQLDLKGVEKNEKESLDDSIGEIEF